MHLSNAYRKGPVGLGWEGQASVKVDATDSSSAETAL